jgi:hypothetical protein
VYRLDLAKDDRVNLITLLTFGLVLRLYAFSQIYLIAKDGAFQYIPVAKLFYEGEYLQALLQPQLPLYPFLISILFHITGDFELAGQMISVIFSLLTIFPLYFMGRSLFGPRVAFWSTVFYLINPLMLQSSVDVLKEGVFIFFFFSSVYCTLRFLKEGRKIWLIWTVVFTISGALARIIALEVLLVLGLWLGYSALRERVREKKLAYHYLWVALLVLGVFLAFVIPGIWGWEFWTTKKPYTIAEGLFQRWFVYQWPSLSLILKRSFYVFGRFIEEAHPLLFLLALFGLGSRVRAEEFGAEAKYLTLMMVVLIIIFFPLLYASGRYLLPAIFLFYLWAGFGFVQMREFIDSRFKRYTKLNAVIPIMVLLLAILPLALKPQRLDKIGRKEVGLWLREYSKSSQVILTNVPRVAYYAQRKYLEADLKLPIEQSIMKGMGARADYVVIEEHRSSISNSLTFFEQEGELELILRYPYGKDGRSISVYRLIPKEDIASTCIVLHTDGAIWSTGNGWIFHLAPYYAGSHHAIDLEYRSDGSYLLLNRDGALWDSTSGWITNTSSYYPGTSYAVDLEFKSDKSYTILHRDGAFWNSSAGWMLTSPPYYKGSGYALDLEYRSDGSYLILHKDGAIYDSVLGWNTNTPPYYPGSAYARDLELISDGADYVILHQDGALWSTSGGWLLTTPPYYPGTHYAAALELVGDGYLILHKNGAIYNSATGWIFTPPPPYPEQDWAVTLKLR